ncbi:hypothetical protein MAPG_03442 [Magnaporthiopsis poae ATCC 64411]|uniref:Uncharacterized protein n=1 Tax=Magnaporthiopsis poae (strain ATCC 64411 / 73-15) TaxID=644358 RepID=A0A0C4DU10_MAGP6|nr:hypothetical protein MAPG_03442 [Magnaporthiopsis poae ATCC 64411]
MAAKVPQPVRAALAAQDHNDGPCTRYCINVCRSGLRPSGRGIFEPDRQPGEACPTLHPTHMSSKIALSAGTLRNSLVTEWDDEGLPSPGLRRPKRLHGRADFPIL